MSLVTGHSSVKGIIFGHVHQQVDLNYQGIRMLSVPATSMQFKPHSEQLDFDRLQHGYRMLTVSADGDFDTSVEMIIP
jgi:Icc protein